MGAPKRKIHQADRRARVRAVGDRLHAACLQVAVVNQFLYRDAQQLDGREGQDGHRLFDRGLEQVFCPLIHVSFHLGQPPHQLFIRFPVPLRYHAPLPDR